MQDTSSKQSRFEDEEEEDDILMDDVGNENVNLKGIKQGAA